MCPRSHHQLHQFPKSPIMHSLTVDLLPGDALDVDDPLLTVHLNDLALAAL